MRDAKERTMTNSSTAQFIRPLHSLGKAVVADGPARMDPKLLKKAEAVVAKMERDFPIWAGQYLEEIRELLDDAKAHPDTTKEEAERIFTLIMDLKGQAGSYGFMMMTEVGDLLKRYTEPLDRIDTRNAEVIEAHLEALDVVLRERTKGDGGEIGRQIVANLRKLVAGPA